MRSHIMRDRDLDNPRERESHLRAHRLQFFGLRARSNVLEWSWYFPCLDRDNHLRSCLARSTGAGPIRIWTKRSIILVLVR